MYLQIIHGIDLKTQSILNFLQHAVVSWCAEWEESMWNDVVVDAEVSLAG